MKLQVKILLFSLLIASIFWVTSCDARLIGLMMSAKSHDFGNVALGDSDTFSVKIENISTKAININNSSLFGSDSYEITDGGGAKTLGGKQSYQITVKFEPKIGGPLQATLSIFHNGPGATRTLNLSGIGLPVPRLNIVEDSYDFGIVLVGNSATHDFSIENVGTADLTLSGFSFTGANYAEYSISSGGNIPIFVSPGATHTISVTLTPISDGMKPTELQITHNAYVALSPAIITITGEGVTHAAEISLNQTTPWDFGQVTVNNTASKEITATNTGITDLEITSVSVLTGQNFSVSGVVDSNTAAITAPFIVTPGDFIVATIEFNPTTATNYNDTLEFIHDGINAGSPLNIALTGSGKTPTTVTINFSGNIVNWSVPAGVTSMEIEAFGAGNST